jgi:hypothetical protein
VLPALRWRGVWRRCYAGSAAAVPAHLWHLRGAGRPSLAGAAGATRAQTVRQQAAPHMPAGATRLSSQLACAPLLSFTREALAAPTVPADCRRSSSPGAAPKLSSRRVRLDRRWPFFRVYLARVHGNFLQMEQAAAHSTSAVPSRNCRRGSPRQLLSVCGGRHERHPSRAAHLLVGVVMVILVEEGKPVPAPNAAAAYLAAQRRQECGSGSSERGEAV